MCLALVVIREGLSLGHEVSAGNRVDVTTVEEIVSAMETRFGLAQRIWVMDRGMVSQAKVEWPQSAGRRYRVHRLFHGLPNCYHRKNHRNSIA